jgi:hypothetical protein
VRSWRSERAGPALRVRPIRQSDPRGGRTEARGPTSGAIGPSVRIGKMNAVTATVMALCRTGQHMIVSRYAYKQTCASSARCPQMRHSSNGRADWGLQGDGARSQVTVSSLPNRRPTLSHVADVDESFVSPANTRVLSVFDIRSPRRTTRGPWIKASILSLSSTDEVHRRPQRISITRGPASWGRSDVINPIYSGARMTAACSIR